jgi:hypothetical protein
MLLSCYFMFFGGWIRITHYSSILIFLLLLLFKWNGVNMYGEMYLNVLVMYIMKL